MKTATTTWVIACVLGIAAIGVSPANAQSTLGGAKPPQNKVGGVAKPQPVVGGATIHAGTPPASPKSNAVVSTSKPGTPGATPGAMGASTTSGQTAGNTHPNPPVNTQGKGVVTANMKCAQGTCAARVPKP